MKICWGGKELSRDTVLQIAGILLLLVGFVVAIKCTAELENQVAESRLMKYLVERLQGEQNAKK